MWSFIRARFEVEILGEPLPRVDSGQLWVSTHRAETDVPLVAGMLHVRAGMWRRRRTRVHFAARDDLFEPGVVTAGLPLPPAIARRAWSLTPGPWLPRVRVHPIRRPSGLKLAQLLGEAPPEAPLAAMLGTRMRDLLARRARQLGLPEPATAGEASRVEFAAVLWQDITKDDLAAPLGDERWRAHIARAAGDVRRLVRLVAARMPLLVYPEGRVSPDGDVGPLGDLIEVLIRRGRPDAIVPIAIAYDPLGSRRTHVAVGVGRTLTWDDPDVAGRLLAELRRSTPATTGQVVAGLLAQREGIVDVAALTDAVAEQVAQDEVAGRPVVAGLARPERRRAAVDRAVRSLARRGAVGEIRDGAIQVSPNALKADGVAARLITEHRAVRP